jgi:hypothetical protein
MFIDFTRGRIMRAFQFKLNSTAFSDFVETLVCTFSLAVLAVVITTFTTCDDEASRQQIEARKSVHVATTNKKTLQKGTQHRAAVNANFSL